MHRFQSREFRIRAEVQPAADILRSTPTVGARLVRRQGQIGGVRAGRLYRNRL
jgi:hypothetical protein